jgi:hypothetical protein
VDIAWPRCQSTRMRSRLDRLSSGPSPASRFDRLATSKTAPDAGGVRIRPVASVASGPGQALLTHSPVPDRVEDHDDGRLVAQQRVQGQRRLTPDEIVRLIDGRGAGLRIADLASEFGINRTTVIRHLRRNGEAGTPTP